MPEFYRQCCPKNGGEKKKSQTKKNKKKQNKTKTLAIDMSELWKDRVKGEQTDKTTPKHTKECLM